MLQQQIGKNTLKKVYTKPEPTCPMSSHHSVTTNLFGDWVCESCAKTIEELEATIQIIE